MYFRSRKRRLVEMERSLSWDRKKRKDEELVLAQLFQLSKSLTGITLRELRLATCLTQYRCQSALNRLMERKAFGLTRTMVGVTAYYRLTTA